MIHHFRRLQLLLSALSPLCPTRIHSSHSRPILWGSKILQDPPTVTYEQAMAEDERGLFKWLSNVVSRLCTVQRIIGVAYAYCVG